MKHGEILDKKYKIVGYLGQGGTAQVLLAENIVLGNIWAIKVIPKNSQWISRQMDEVDILKRLSHPMLPRIADLLDDNDNLYIVMDYFSGSNLMDILQKEGRISEKVLVEWTYELIDVLKYLHDRNPPVIYRDLKPSNIIVDDSGRLRLIDFGTAMLHREDKCEDTIYIGTQGYAAPEQYGNGRSDQRTDLYNLGMTLVHLATGVHPLNMEKGRMGSFLKDAGVSRNFIKFILGLTEPDPANRIQDADTALKVLKNGSGLKNRRFFISPAGKHGKTVFRGIIGVASYFPGNGATSLCIALGRFLSGKGKKTALIELNSSGDFNRIGEILDDLGELKVRRENSFETGNMIFYPDISDLSEIPRKGVDAIILDIGQLNTEQKLRELNRTDIKLIMCPGASWKHALFAEYNEVIKSNFRHEWIYITSNTDRYERQRLSKSVQHLVPYSLPKNPYYLTEEERRNTEKFFRQICLISNTKND